MHKNNTIIFSFLFLISLTQSPTLFGAAQPDYFLLHGIEDPRDTPIINPLNDTNSIKISYNDLFILEKLLNEVMVGPDLSKQKSKNEKMRQELAGLALLQKSRVKIMPADLDGASSAIVALCQSMKRDQTIRVHRESPMGRWVRLFDSTFDPNNVPFRIYAPLTREDLLEIQRLNALRLTKP